MQNTKNFISLAAPYIDNTDIELVNKVLNSKYLSLGPYLKTFEKELCNFSKRKYALATSSGTAALYMGLCALEVSEKDEIITSPFSFIASANVIEMCRATTVFCDIDPIRFCIDPNKIENLITSRTVGILGVDVFGYMMDIDKIKKIARKYSLFIVEDACEAIGTTYKGKSAGYFGDISTFGFYPNKQITTGEGGAALTNNKKLWLKMAMLRNQGRAPRSEWLKHEILGYNFRLDEMSCALGVAQLRKINFIKEKRRKAYFTYMKYLSQIDHITLPPPELEGESINPFVFVILLPPDIKKENIKKKLFRRGIQTGDYFPVIHLQPYYKKKYGYQKGDFPIAEDISSRSLALPFFTSITEEQIKYVYTQLKKIL